MIVAKIASGGKGTEIVGIQILQIAQIDDQSKRPYPTHRVDEDAPQLDCVVGTENAMPLDVSVGRTTGAITVPTTYVWSNSDIAIGRRAAELTSRWAAGPFDF